MTTKLAVALGSLLALTLAPAAPAADIEGRAVTDSTPGKLTLTEARRDSRALLKLLAGSATDRKARCVRLTRVRAKCAISFSSSSSTYKGTAYVRQFATYRRTRARMKQTDHSCMELREDDSTCVAWRSWTYRVPIAQDSE